LRERSRWGRRGWWASDESRFAEPVRWTCWRQHRTGWVRRGRAMWSRD